MGCVSDEVNRARSLPVPALAGRRTSRNPLSSRVLRSAPIMRARPFNVFLTSSFTIKSTYLQGPWPFQFKATACVWSPEELATCYSSQQGFTS